MLRGLTPKDFVPTIIFLIVSIGGFLTVATVTNDLILSIVYIEIVLVMATVAIISYGEGCRRTRAGV